MNLSALLLPLKKIKRAILKADTHALNLLKKLSKASPLFEPISKRFGLLPPQINKAPLSILFICRGNICRSAYAEAVFKKMLARPPLKELRIEVLSAGTLTREGKDANEKAISRAAVRGIDLSEHKTTCLTLAAAEKADLLLIKDFSHRKAIRKIDPKLLKKTFYLGSLTEGELIIEDPYGKDKAVFDECFDSIDQALEALADAMKVSVSKPIKQ